MIFGQKVLSHPLVVEAIESQFVPVAVFNNVGGKDKEILTRFKEPSWNNPVVRFTDAKGQDLIPRRDRVWTAGPLVRRMVASLEKAKRPVPGWLRLLEIDAGPPAKERATFAMHCYWEGEAKLGALKGVLGTRSAWLEGLEVVEVDFDPTRIAYPDLVKQARLLECASKVFTRTDQQHTQARRLVGDQAVRTGSRAKDAKASDQLYYLRNSRLRHLPLSRLQATRVNAALGTKKDPTPWLSPTQRSWAARLAKMDAARLKTFTAPAPAESTDDLARSWKDALKRFGS